jgi:hypothetical protein
MRRTHIALLVGAAALAGCTTVPTGPSTLALPGTNKGFEQFQSDDGACRQYASDSIGGATVAQAQQDSGARSLLAGAVIGALIGGAVNGGHGAAVGAGVGGAAGGLAGVGASEVSGSEAQRRYDHAYTQCMYGRGHRVAVSGYLPRTAARPYYPPARYSYPPPPPGYPPPAATRSYPPPPPPGSAPPPPPPGSAPGT